MNNFITRSCVLLLIGIVASLQGMSSLASGPLTFEERVKAQEAIERVYYNHRIWPKENPQPKPPFEQMVPKAVIEAKVTDYLRKCAALDEFLQHPITPRQLQAEMDRMARQTRDPSTLRELFAALGNDPALIAECLARPLLSERLAGETEIANAQSDGGVSAPEPQLPDAEGSYTLPSLEGPPVPETDCQDAWLHTAMNDVLDPRYLHTGVWTGTEMIVWGGTYGGTYLGDGGRYTPATDMWGRTSLGTGCPTGRYSHAAVWTGTEMIVWGGSTAAGLVSDGGRYDPISDTWTVVSTGANCPAERTEPQAVWTGSEMIVWGGLGASSTYLNTGGRYNPTGDTWTATSTGTNCPTGRYRHTLVWTGTEMIVWGGYGGSNTNTGGRYNPTGDTWTATSTGTNCPTARNSHIAVWTGSVMVVWGGTTGSSTNTGGRYNPTGDSWSATSTGTNCPSARYNHSAVWTGSVMIVWGGGILNTGGRYNPSGDSWIATSTGTNTPTGREHAAAVWTGTEMIIWGGYYSSTTTYLDTGARYNPTADSWVPTSAAGLEPPVARTGASAVWTGAEMIVWGGQTVSASARTNTGSCYSPATDSWSATSTGASCPTARYQHTAIWTGSEMIIWGGDTGSKTNTGGRYNPVSNAWTATSTGTNCPVARSSHVAVWTGSLVIVWGGYTTTQTNTGGRYTPATDSWSATSTGTNCAPASQSLGAVWTGTEMIVWGGLGSGATYRNTGGRYNPDADTWQATSTGANCPAARMDLTMLWTGTKALVWGGRGPSAMNSGALYSPSDNTWVATSTGTNCPSARYAHAAIWDGVDMVLWGGWDGTNAFNSGGRYSPDGDAWAVVATAPYAPGSRYSHSEVWAGDKMIVWGGRPYTGQGWTYTPGPRPSATAAPSLTDLDPCGSGIQVSWSEDPEDWNDSGTGTRGYRLWRNGAPLPAGGCSGAIVYGATQCVDATAAANTALTYQVEYVNSCSASGLTPSAAIQDVAVVPPSVTGPATGCASPGVLQSTQAYSAYQWSVGGLDIPGATGQTYAATASGTYAVRVTDGSGCVASSLGRAVTVYALPTPTVTGPSHNPCGTLTASLSTQSYSAYQWYKDSAPLGGATVQNYAATQSGTYTVAVSDSNGCQNASPGWAVTIQDCADEVSGIAASVKARLVPDASSSTGYYLYFQKIAYAVGYSCYEGTLPAIEAGAYDHGSGARCDIAATDLGTGEMRAEFAPSDGGHYYLVTAHSATVEGPSGFDSTGVEIPKSQSTCAP